MRAYMYTFEGKRVTLESEAELLAFYEEDGKNARKAAGADKRRDKAARAKHDDSHSLPGNDGQAATPG